MTYAVGVLIILACMVGAGTGVFLVRTLVRLETLKAHHVIGGTIFLQIGVVYAVLLAFVVTVVWAQFNAAAEAADNEVASLLAVFGLSSGLPDPARSDIQQAIIHYTQAVVDDEWPAMSRRADSEKAVKALEHLMEVALRFEPQNAREEAIYGHALSRLSEAREQRHYRLFQMTLAVPGFMWWLLVVTGVILVALSYFFGIEYLWSQAIFTAALAGTIAFILVLIMLLDYPFTGDLTVPPDAFTMGLRRFAQALGH